MTIAIIIKQCDNEKIRNKTLMNLDLPDDNTYADPLLTPIFKASGQHGQEAVGIGIFYARRVM